MLSLPSKAPTILDYVDTSWWGTVCSSCGAPIDVCWLPDERDHDGQWAGHTWFATHCPECVLAAAPDDVRSSLGERFKRLRLGRLSLGLGSVTAASHLGLIEPESSARKSLNWHSGFITLEAGTRRRNTTGKARPMGLYMELFVIKGTVAEPMRSQLDPASIARLPWFDLNGLEPPDDAVEVARVTLGATVRDPQLPGLEWRYSWNRSVPASFGFFSLPPFWQEREYSAHQIGRFVGKAMDLFRKYDKGGRPSEDADCEWYIDEAARYLEARPGTPPTKADFVKFTGRPESTMRGHLDDCGLWPWKIFRAHAFPRQSASRG